jgi:hypothetical protein
MIPGLDLPKKWTSRNSEQPSKVHISSSRSEETGDPASPRRRRIIGSARGTGVEADRHLDRPLLSRTSMHNLSRTNKAFSGYFSRYYLQGYFLRKEHGSGLFAGTLFRMEVCDLTRLASASTKAGSFETRADIINGSIRINTATQNPALKADNKE